MKNLYVHIGLGKTGTTAIQSYCNKWNEYLLQNDLYYPVLNSRIDHYYFNKYLITGKLDNAIDFINECFGVSENVLISSEFLSRDPHNLLFLKKICDNVKIIIYLRRQDQILESAYQQHVKLRDIDGLGKPKLGLSKIFDEWVEEKKGLDWFQVLKRWSEYFGKENLIVRVFEKEQLLNQDIVDDFLNIFRIKKKEDVSISLKVNRGLTPTMIEFLRIMNSFADNDSEPIMWYQLDKCIKIGLLEVEKKYKFLSNSQRKEILIRYEESNQKVANKFLNRCDGKLFLDTIVEQDQGVDEVTKEGLMFIANQIVHHLITQLSDFKKYYSKNKLQ